MGLILRQTLAILPVLLVRFMSGIGIAWLPPTLHRLENTYFTPEECVWVAVLHYLTKGTSPFLAVFAVDLLGRRWIFVGCAFIFFFMWIAVYASKVVLVHYAIRLMFGVGVGMGESTVGIYIGENSSTELRGVFSGLTHAFFYGGMILEYVLAMYLSYEWLAICNGALGFLVILSMYFLRESAHFLIARNKTKKAERQYDYLYDLKSAKTRIDFENIKLYVREQRACIYSSTRVYRSKDTFKSVRIVLLVSFLSQACGFSVANLFVAEAVSPTHCGWKVIILLAACQFVSACLGSAFMDTFNRRTLFLLSGVNIAIVQAATAVMFFVNATHFFFLVLLTSSSCVIAMFTLPLMTAIQGELLSQNVKAVGSGFAASLGTISAFLVEIFLPVADFWGIKVDFILFSFVASILTIYLYFDLPETKGKTLVDIQRELKRVDAARRPAPPPKKNTDSKRLRTSSQNGPMKMKNK